ncbi:CaiB/BaiF CoA transferase family protein [Microbulbifer sp. ZKSA004]|uniref:CaiB/BaiF CoA transferase family protein n=1 Tax=Microbulbifer sp. ZKSA004 TaxID=3243389 RepID=UPI00403A1368
MLPLAGLRIVAVEQYGAGPFGTLYLANLGAEIIKVEDISRGGDVGRTVGPYFLEGEPGDNSSLFFQTFNHNKRSLSLNLSSPQGQQILHKLILGADALTDNLRGDVPDKLGITYKQLGKLNPKIVCAHLTAYGRSGDRAKWPGYDYPVQAEAGYFKLTGEPDSPPTRCGLSLVDLSTGVALALAVVSGVLNARETGKGRDIDVSLFDNALYNLSYVAMWQLNAGHNQKRVPRSAHFSLSPCQLYKTKDDWIYLMCNKEKFWKSLCQCIEHPELADAPKFVNFRERRKNQSELTEILDEILSKKDTAEWLKILAGQVPAAPVYDVEQALTNPFVSDTDRIQTMPSDHGKDIKILAPSIRCDGEMVNFKRAPTLGEDTKDILAELGYSGAEIAKLAKYGII